jgi:hypothetical protein
MGRALDHRGAEPEPRLENDHRAAADDDFVLRGAPDERIASRAHARNRRRRRRRRAPSSGTIEGEGRRLSSWTASRSPCRCSRSSAPFWRSSTRVALTVALLAQPNVPSVRRLSLAARPPSRRKTDSLLQLHVRNIGHAFARQGESGSSMAKETSRRRPLGFPRQSWNLMGHAGTHL